MSERAINSYQDLTVWQDGMVLAELCYRRSAASIPANIAEGHGRESTQSFVQYLRMSQGSLKELETHLLLSERVGLLTQQQIKAPMEQCASLGRRIRVLIRSLQQKAKR